MLDQSRKWQSVSVASLLVVTLTAYGQVGCVVEDARPSGSDNGQTETPAPTTISATTAIDGVEIEVWLQRSSDGQRFVGSRTLSHVDGTIEEEPLDLHRSELSKAEPTANGFVLPDMGGETLTVVSTQSWTDGASMVLRSSSGQEVAIEVSGDVSYAILGSVGWFVAIVCGLLVYYAVRTCNRQNKCWTFELRRGFCAGSCRNCEHR